jgi:hypothetical protein
MARTKQTARCAPRRPPRHTLRSPAAPVFSRLPARSKQPSASSSTFLYRLHKAGELAGRARPAPSSRGEAARDACAAGSEMGPHAPQLPLDAVRRILAPHAGDVYTLCAAACVSRVWRDAAKASALWRNLNIAFQPPCLHPLQYNVTDERLAELVTRAGTGVGGEPHLERLDVTGCLYVSTRGVVAALAGANLQGKLTVLRVANTVCEQDDAAGSSSVEDVIADLQTFLQRRDGVVHAPATLDVDKPLLCEERGCDVDCPRICAGFRCDACKIPCCDFCFEDMAPDQGQLLCKHYRVCNGCDSMRAGERGCMGCDEDITGASRGLERLSARHARREGKTSPTSCSVWCVCGAIVRPLCSGDMRGAHHASPASLLQLGGTRRLAGALVRGPVADLARLGAVERAAACGAALVHAGRLLARAARVAGAQQPRLIGVQHRHRAQVRRGDRVPLAALATHRSLVHARAGRVHVGPQELPAAGLRVRGARLFCARSFEHALRRERCHQVPRRGLLPHGRPAGRGRAAGGLRVEQAERGGAPRVRRPCVADGGNKQ